MDRLLARREMECMVPAVGGGSLESMATMVSVQDMRSYCDLVQLTILARWRRRRVGELVDLCQGRRCALASVREGMP